MRPNHADTHVEHVPDLLTLLYITNDTFSYSPKVITVASLRQSVTFIDVLLSILGLLFIMSSLSCLLFFFTALLSVILFLSLSLFSLYELLFLIVIRISKEHKYAGYV